MNATIVSLNVGKPVTMQFQGKEVSTAIGKQPVDEPVYLSSLNFSGDEQADLVNHGGKDKAVCVYSHDHYEYWRNKLGFKLEAAAFGENLTVRGVTEADICIGDVYRLGEAVVQVSQPRQPCYKLAVKHDVPDFVQQVQENGYTGFYFRVLQEGWVDPKHGLQLITRDPAGISIAYVNQIKYHDKENREAIKRILQVEALADSLRHSLEKRLAE